MTRMTTISHKFPCHPCRKERQINIQHPAVLQLAKKKKAKIMEKENDLVVSSGGSDSQLSEAEDK